MKFRKLKVGFMRLRLKRCNFYDGVFFSNDIVRKKVEKSVAEWMTYLKDYKEIEIKKFRDLFIKLNDEVTFPIKIKESYGEKLDIKFTDVQGNKYYMSKRNIVSYSDVNKYLIGKRSTGTESFDEEIYYKINQNASIDILKENITKINQDENSSESKCELCYTDDENVKEITLYSYSDSTKIEVKYVMKHDRKVDELVIKYLLVDVAAKWYSYNVLPIFKWMLETTGSLSISITSEIDEDVFSEIEVSNGIVQKYTFTKVIDEGEMHIIKKIFAKTLDEFFNENKTN